jgi:hypothetical protein
MPEEFKFIQEFSELTLRYTVTSMLIISPSYDKRNQKPHEVKIVKR